MLTLVALFIPFFALVLLGWVAVRRRFVPPDSLGGLNVFVLFFALPALLLRLGAGGVLSHGGFGSLLLAYGLGGAVVLAGVALWAWRQGLGQRDTAYAALATVFPNTGFLGLPLLMGLLGPQAAGPLAATFLVDVVLFSSLCLAWADAKAARTALAGAMKNPLLWSMALGVAVASAGLTLPHPLDETLKMLGQSATPVALFTLGGILARAQMQAESHRKPAPVTLPVVLKLVVHPAAVLGAGWALQRAGVEISSLGWMTLVMAAALPSASNVSMLAERARVDTGLVARIILWTTVGALLSLALWAHQLGLQTPAG